jgi:hypothetical protein
MKSLITKVLLITFVISLTGCLFGPKDERQAFIDAFIEAECTVFGPDVDDQLAVSLNDEVLQIFEKHGFDDDQDVRSIVDKYLLDEDAKAMILEGMAECNPEEFGNL